jgi:hypothetical protein
MDVATFKFVHKKIHRFLNPPRLDSRGRKALRTELVMASALLYLATGNSYASVSQSIRNGMTETSVMRNVRMFNKGVVTKLAPRFITFPTTRAGLARNARYFEDRSMIPGIIGAIDGSHIKVAPPRRHESSYYNRKGFHSVILSAVSPFTLTKTTTEQPFCVRIQVCDPRGYFMAIDVGFPGRMADSKALRYTPLYQCGLAGLDITFTVMLRTLSCRG